MSTVPRSLTAPPRSRSKKANLQRHVAALLAQAGTSARWTTDGFHPDLALLANVLATTDPKDVRGGSVAVGLDMWAAEMLRAAGLDAVQPYAAEPFYADVLSPTTASAFATIDARLEDISEREQRIAEHLPTAIRQATKTDRSGLKDSIRILKAAVQDVRKRVEQSTTTILGEGRRKQVDVFLTRWDRGLELLISTKTIALAADESELVKNLSNRWEEFDGDLKNLRGRFPLAVIGALLVIPSHANDAQRYAFADMMTKLTAPGRPWVNAYDQTAIVVVDTWEAGAVDAVHVLGSGALPSELRPEIFFTRLIERLFERSPISEHVRARKLRDVAHGLDPSIVEAAAEMQASADGLDDDAET